MTVDRDYVVIEKGGDFDHYGLVTFREGELGRAELRDLKYIILFDGGRELLPGLFYYGGPM